MKLYQKGYEVLCCMKDLRLKRKMGFALTLSDMERLPLFEIKKEKKKAKKRFLKKQSLM